MTLEEDLAEDNTSSPPASDTQVPQDTTTDAEEVIKCPICWDTIRNEGSIACCRHIFCFSCIREWSHIRAACPICQLPFHSIHYKVGPDNYEVYHVVQDTGRGARRRRWPRSVERRQRLSPVRLRRSSSSPDLSSASGDHGAGRAGYTESGRSRSHRRHHDGLSRAHPHSSSSRREQQSRAQDMARDTAHEEGPAPRPERDVPASSGTSETRQRGGPGSSREQQAARSRSQRRFRSTRDTEGNTSGRQREHQRRRRGQRHATRSRSQRRSRSTWSQTEQEHPRRRRDRRHTSRSRSQRRPRSTRRLREREDQSRRHEGHATRSPSQRRSRSTQRRQRAHQRRRDQRHTSRSRSQRRSRSPATRRAW